MFKTNSMALKYLRRIRQIKVFGFFHGYFVNTDLFCHFYTSINDQPVALTRTFFMPIWDIILECYFGMMSRKFVMIIGRDLGETTESGPLCATDLFQDKTFSLFFQLFQLFVGKILSLPGVYSGAELLGTEIHGRFYFCRRSKLFQNS